METRQGFYVAGIGASAGSLEAYQQLLPHLKHDNICYIICQHMSPHHKSMLPEILRKSTEMVVEHIEGVITLKPGHIYIANPNGNIHFESGSAHFKETVSNTLPRPNINQFLTSLGQSFGPNSIGIILSGSGNDGALGLQAIQASGGIALVQQPQTATYDSMPQAAIQGNHAEFIGPPTDIAHFINQYLDNSHKQEEASQHSYAY